MAWERRGKRGRLVYYSVSKTIEGKVVKQYLGRGERAIAAAAVVAQAKMQREADWVAVQEEQARLIGPDGLALELIAVVDLLMAATLIASGFHRRNWGKWRKCRDKEENRAATRTQSRR